ncbi:MAG: D-alanine--D-alanine ligase, partial [Alphaproteobacteria bacterium]|nr:D-alanine--D-alanine ligase [Alphaproteobacteria bacterium]
MAKRIAVLMGGRSAEREISLISGAAVADALIAGGNDVTLIDVGPGVAAELADCKPDVAFNALHGRFGEDGCIQGLLETMEIPYTHSGVLASALAMDKPTALTLFAEAGIRCPEGVVATWDDARKGGAMAPPYVVKPTNEGSSVGVILVTEDGAIDDLAGDDFPEKVLVERFIPGRELTVAVMGGSPMGVTEIKPAAGFYDYQAKYAEGGSVHVVPADLSDVVFEACMNTAAAAHDRLGCRGVSRADFRYDDSQDGATGVYLL